jgi:hypothetical protein
MTRNAYVLPIASLSLLLIPLIAMQFSDQVNWSPGDFVVMGLLLLSVGFGMSFFLRRTASAQKRFAYILILLLVFLLIWAELAVGIFGSPLAGS